MPNRYERSDAALFAARAMLSMRRMKVELNEHRYSLERNVERETALLHKRIALLESCNATLSARLAEAQKEVAALKRQPAPILPKAGGEPVGRVEKLYVINSKAQKSAVPEKWGGHAAVV